MQSKNKAKEWPSEDDLLKKMFPSIEEKVKTFIPYDEIERHRAAMAKKEQQIFWPNPDTITMTYIEETFKSIFEERNKNRVWNYWPPMSKAAIEMLHEAIKKEALRNNITHEGKH